MKAIIQRVINASVAVDGQIISSIGKGLLVLVGIDRYDEPNDATQIIKKVLTARLFDDEQGGMWKKSVKDINGEVLCVSQFTLLAKFKASTKPDFHESMSTIPGKAYYTNFLEEMGKSYNPNKIKDGQFGAMMQVSLTNDGPVTIILDSRSSSSLSSSSSSVKSTPNISRSITPNSNLSTKKSKSKNKNKDKVEDINTLEKDEENYNKSSISIKPSENCPNGIIDVSSISSISGTIANLGLGTNGNLEKEKKLI
ncbi:D-tyrosyl-tRNA(Tyr) deacylase [Kwoniella pini CBS 10737]|uniref:D-aminoacyl-tRNA deacylase n=1 Tax=Kwoniella pini CBS 10737 TaxID=1296096 RepID=A0A1B9I9I3_9TREE|nr:D-tyrosyl-tRNA(Tyr) deacylase [Kwoniella pini CBS 10737]OCF52268.1 D-tyrosyl-tRNA(Tyr) deacylase [Kwoniella pini CBS 10737]